MNTEPLESLELRDIHLPEPVSWWPLAPGWWLLAAALVLAVVALYIARKRYLSRQLKRDIASELETVRQQFQQTGNRSELARSLSILLRRACISYYPSANIAGLTGEHWLNLLDSTNSRAPADMKFQSDIGQLLINAPYQPEPSLADYDAEALIGLCESWLLSPHDNRPQSLPQALHQANSVTSDDKTADTASEKVSQT